MFTKENRTNSGGIMSVKIVDHSSKIISDFKVKSSIFLRLIADEIVNIATPKTPKNTGRLRSDILKQVSGTKGKIIWGKNYGIYQETKKFKNYTTPGTGPHFAKDAVGLATKKTGATARKAGL